MDFNIDFWEDLIENLQNWVITELPGIVIITILLFVSLSVAFFTINKLNKTLIKRAERNDKTDAAESLKRINTLTGILEYIVKISLLTIFFMVLLQKFGIEIAPLIAGAGIAGLALGFGAQELVRDYISGFYILLENQIRTGDVAIINGTGGLVEKIELRTITLRDLEGIVHIFQNGKINTMSNVTKDWSAAVFDIGVAYKENVGNVIHIMKHVGDQLQATPEYKEMIIEPIEVFGLDAFDENALVIKARIKTMPGSQWGVGREYRKRLKSAFDDQNIEIPYPHRTLIWDEENKSQPGFQ
ncbi:MAG: mechanosensitive ion channel family protein [Balneolales bacterium]